MKRTTKATGHTMKRTTSMQIRLSEEEAEKLKAAARAEGLPVGAWLRALGLKAAAGLLLLCLALPARALDRWTWQDTAWEGAFVLALGADWSQTRYAMHRPEAWQEGNPILGKHPSEGRLAAYNAIAIAFHAGVSAILPTKWRRTWQCVTVGVEVYQVGRNYSVGTRFEF